MNYKKIKKSQLLTIISLILLFQPLIIAYENTIQTNNNEQHEQFNNQIDDWWDSEWKYRKPILINHTKIQGNLTNFPLLVSIEDDDLATKAQPDGDDIVFTTTTTEKLNHEIEYYNSTNGTLITWVQLPTLNSTGDTTIYLYYGNLNCSNQQNSEATWDSYYKAVYHFGETTGNATDSTSNNNDGIPYGNLTQNVPGKIGKTAYFDGVDDHLILPQLYSNETQFTFETWIYPQTGARYFTSQWNNYSGVFLQVAANQNNVEWYINNNAGSITIPTLEEWYHIVLTYDGTEAKIYRNTIGPNIKTSNPPTWPSEGMYIGDRSEGNRQFHGLIDELRFSIIARDANWITTSYNNQNDTASFHTIGDEEIVPNQPPNKPTEPQPENNSFDVPITTTLSVLVTDPDNDTMNVFFYDASNNNLIDVDVNVSSGERAEILVTELEYSTTYTWYVIANDTTAQTQSDTWSFTTENGSIPPTITIIKPEEKSFYFRDQRLFRFLKTVILGHITILAQAEDDTGIKEVRFYIDGELRHTSYNPVTMNLYSWTWNDRIWIRHRHTIKVVAVDVDNNVAEDTRQVSIRNFPLLHPLRP